MKLHMLPNGPLMNRALSMYDIKYVHERTTLWKLASQPIPSEMYFLSQNDYQIRNLGLINKK